MSPKQQRKQPFRFKSHRPIGAVQAELDHEFLEKCFVETGDLDAALDIDSPRSIIIGRTGVGKSALLMRVRDTQDHAIEVSPENLSIDYIANSNILSFFEAAGVNLDVLFRLLWRHVLVVELLRYRYCIRNQSAMDRFIQTITETVNKDRSKEKDLNYLRQWGDSFWEETEYRVKEVVSRIESELSASINASAFDIGAGADAATKLTDQERKEVLNRGKQAVAKVQIKDLGEVIKVLSEDVFVDKQKKYYLIIDRLDENWADQSIRYKLIRALLEELRTFRNIETVKILVSLRLDLLEKVFEKTRDSGFQEEKYRDLLMPIRWSKEDLYQLVRLRVEHVLRYKYTTQQVTFGNIFPGRIGKRKTFDYILERTLYRPRDVIVYVNFVLEKAVGRSSIPVALVKSVEEDYSEERFRSFQFEWASIFPSLESISKVLENRSESFRVQEIADSQLESIALDLISGKEVEFDQMTQFAKDFLSGDFSKNNFRYAVVNCLYHVGMVGIKKGPQSAIKWSFESDTITGPLNIKPDTRVYIHPMFWRRFEIRNGEM